MNKIFNRPIFCFIILFSVLFCSNITVAMVKPEKKLIPIHSKKTYVIPQSNAKMLSKALLEVKNGDKVLLSGGVYKGNFEINKTIELTSNKDSILTSDSDGTILRVNAPNVDINHVIFKNSGDFIQNQDSCLFVSKGSHNINISNNIFKGCLFGIWLKGVNNGLIQDNKIIGTTQKMLSNRGNGIQVWFNNGTVIKNNIIKQGRDGIYISNSQKMVVIGNNMHRTRFGVHFMYNEKCTLNNNEVINGSVGLALMYSTYLIVNGNNVQNNDVHGYLLRQVNYSKLLDNFAKGNADGIFFGGSYFNLVKGNELIENNFGVVITSGSKSNTVYDNNFINNRLQAKYLNTSTLKWGHDGRGNYWSDYRGFDLNHDGVGSKPYYVTNLAQWLSYSFPVLKIMFDSPAMGMLQRIENEFPVLRRSALIDKYPLMREIKYVR